MRELARYPAFLWLLAAGGASSLAGWALGIALSVQVYELTHSPLTTSGLLITSLAPSVLLGTFAGVVGDRVSRVRLLKTVSWLRVVIVASLWFSSGTNLPWIFTVPLLQSAAMAFFIPAHQATIAQVVPERLLSAATGLNSATVNTTRLIAPALGGLSVSVLGFEGTTAVVSVLLLISAVLIGRVKVTDQKNGSHGSSVLRDWIEGLKELKANRDSSAITVLQTMDAWKEGMVSALFPVLMLGVIGTSPAIMGVVNSSFALTAIVGGIACPLIVQRYGYRTPIAVGATTTGALLLVLIWLPSTPMALTIWLLSGFPFTVSWVACNTLLLLTTKEHLRARTVGTLGSLYGFNSLIAAAIAGITAELYGVLPVLIVAGIIQTLAGPTYRLMSRHHQPFIALCL